MRFMSEVKRPLQSDATREVALAAFGTLLIAATYGMARFGVGLLHPAMASERPGIEDALPSAGTAQFVSYCLAAGVAAKLVPRRARATAGAAGAVAALGCVGLATSTTSSAFVASAFIAGAGAGLASPALVGLLDAVVRDRMASAAQATVNSGTAIGVIGAGAIATVVAAPELSWWIMAVLCAAPALVVVLLTSRAAPTVAPPPHGTLRASHLAVPAAAALGAGVISSATWTFGPTEVVARGALGSDRIGLLWAALGVGGLAGAFVDRLVRRVGPRTSFALCTGALIAGSLGVLASTDGWWWPTLGAAVFGASYMALSGVLVLWGRLIDRARGGAITAWLFIALAVGQALGAQLLGFAFT